MTSPRLASSYAAAANWEDAVREVLADLPRLPQANLGWLYVSDHFGGALEAILARLRQHTGVLEWVGATGVGVLGTTGAALDAPGLSVMIGAFPEGSYRVFSGRRPLNRDFSAYSAFVHGDPLTPDMSELVKDMSLKVHGGCLGGGLASARDKAWHLANDVLSGGISGVAFDHRIEVLSAVSQGCIPLDGTWQVTQAHDNLIERIDGRPAVQVFMEAAGPGFGADLRRAASNLMIGMIDADGNRQFYTVRHIVALDLRSGRIAINDSVPKGQSIILVRRDENSAREDMTQTLERLRSASAHAPRGAIYVTCASRGGIMFERDDSEIEMIKTALGDIPLTGFFAAGEIAGSKLFGLTGVLTVFL